MAIQPVEQGSAFAFRNVINNNFYELKVLSGASKPTESTAAVVGQMYLDTSEGKMYFCSNVSGSVYTWRPFSEFSGSYNDLEDKPSLFSGSYNDLEDKPSLFSGNYNDLTNKPDSSKISYNNEVTQIDATNVQNAIDELFTFASDGKKKCADAVTGMGVPTASDATFDTIAANIKKIETGPDTSQLTAASAQVRFGYKFIGSAGTIETGTIGNKVGASYYPTYADQTINSGVYLSGNQTIRGLNLAHIVFTNSEYGYTSSNYNSYRKLKIDYRNVGEMKQIKNKEDIGFVMIQFRDGDNHYDDPLLFVYNNGASRLYAMYGSGPTQSSTLSVSISYGGDGSSANNIIEFTLHDTELIHNGSGTSTSGYINNAIWVPKSIYHPGR